MTAALAGGEWSASRPGRTLPPGKIQYTFYSRLGEPQGRSGQAENLVHTGIRSRTFQTIVSRYTDWATRPTQHLINGTIFEGEKNAIEHTVRVLIYSAVLFVWNSSYSEKHWARYDQKFMLDFLFLCDFNDTWIFWTVFSKNTRTSNFIKIRPMLAELCRSDGQSWWS